MLLARLDNTRVYEFHDLLADGRVLHVVLQRLRVGLRLLQDALHDRVAHDVLTFRQS